MLKVMKNISISGQSVINGAVVETYSATISENNPESVAIGSSQMNPAIYKNNRVQCRKNREEFEEYVYKLQDELIAEQSASKTE